MNRRVGGRYCDGNRVATTTKHQEDRPHRYDSSQRDPDPYLYDWEPRPAPGQAHHLPQGDRPLLCYEKLFFSRPAGKFPLGPVRQGYDVMVLGLPHVDDLEGHAVAGVCGTIITGGLGGDLHGSQFGLVRVYVTHGLASRVKLDLFFFAALVFSQVAPFSLPQRREVR